MKKIGKVWHGDDVTREIYGDVYQIHEIGETVK